MSSENFVKNYNNTYLYNANDTYQKIIMEYIMKADRIDQNGDQFESIRYDLTKRQITSDLTKVLLDNHIVLMRFTQKVIPKGLKIFTAKDIKTDRKLKIFIDCSEFKLVDGQWRTNYIDVFVSYLVSAMMQLIYYTDPNRLLMNSSLINYARGSFSTLFSYIVDYLYKINNIESMRNNCLYISALYFTNGICNLPLTDSHYTAARSIAGISERQADMIHMHIDENSFNDIKTFVDTLSRVLKISKMTLDVIIERWIFLFGSGTLFALELFPAFSSMLSDAYCGSYINNQKTIEKIVGKNMVDYTKQLLTISRGVL